MDVICHQAVRVHGTAETLGELAQITQISEVIAFVEEAVPLVVAALHDMKAHLWYDHAGSAGHEAKNGVTAMAVDRYVRKIGTVPVFGK
jgi:hypothetical protein